MNGIDVFWVQPFLHGNAEPGADPAGQVPAAGASYLNRSTAT